MQFQSSWFDLCFVIDCLGGGNGSQVKTRIDMTTGGSLSAATIWNDKEFFWELFLNNNNNNNNNSM